jgi:hypothetical protein
MMEERNELDLKYLEIYGFCDLAAGKEARAKRRTARQVISIAARDWLDRWFFIYIWAGRETATDFKKRIVDAQEMYRPRIFGLEANGMQVLYGSLVREEARLRCGSKVKMIPVYQPTNVDKDFRIRSGLEPLIAQGRLFILPELTDAWIELRGFPTAATKDIVDAMETTIRLAPKRAIVVQNRAEREQYAAYLRSTRIPAHLIEQKMFEFDSGRGQ